MSQTPEPTCDLSPEFKADKLSTFSDLKGRISDLFKHNKALYTAYNKKHVELQQLHKFIKKLTDGLEVVEADVIREGNDCAKLVEIMLGELTELVAGQEGEDSQNAAKLQALQDTQGEIMTEFDDMEGKFNFTLPHRLAGTGEAAAAPATEGPAEGAATGDVPSDVTGPATGPAAGDSSDDSDNEGTPSSGGNRRRRKRSSRKINKRKRRNVSRKGRKGRKNKNRSRRRN
jgi:Mg-chelatase subunit ChlI